MFVTHAVKFASEHPIPNIQTIVYFCTVTQRSKPKPNDGNGTGQTIPIQTQRP